MRWRRTTTKSKRRTGRTGRASRMRWTRSRRRSKRRTIRRRTRMRMWRKRMANLPQRLVSDTSCKHGGT